MRLLTVVVLSLFLASSTNAQFFDGKYFASCDRGGTADTASPRCKLYNPDSTTVQVPEGTYVENVRGGQRYFVRLDSDSTLRVPDDTMSVATCRWSAYEVTHSDSAPGKLVLNPGYVPDGKRACANLAAKTYLRIPANGHISMWHVFGRLSPLTIPLTFRPALSDSIGSKASADLKAGAYLSINLNRVNFHNRVVEAANTRYGLTAGVALGVSKVALDSTSTSLDPSPITSQEDGISLFLALGSGVNLGGFQIGGFVGWEFGITDNVEKWNYDGERFYGIAIGVDLNAFSFFKS